MEQFFMPSNPKSSRSNVRKAWRKKALLTSSMKQYITINKKVNALSTYRHSRDMKDPEQQAKNYTQSVCCEHKIESITGLSHSSVSFMVKALALRCLVSLINVRALYVSIVDLIEKRKE
ncbi:CLUMA_CG012361, isoform A [Clunio marinus]|uniref:CLUMA_CG012361, isoform A n=1 Tax=Clunio marinus TaxID=568069 RepID=A0A1J1IFT2_9DIPT|nr:CLUMA_CG012361, isoform A [Clunio marinus]